MHRAPLALLITAVALAATVGCSTSDDTPDRTAPPAQDAVAAPLAATDQGATPAAATPTAQPKTLAAVRTAAQQEFDLYAAGDWAGAWDLWTAAGQAALTRADYVRVHTECKTLTGITFDITGTRLEGEDSAIVTYKRLVVAGTGIMVYEDGAWRWQPTPEDMADYKLGADRMIAGKKAEGGCG